ncbi:MAG TPA: DUF503 domain-containing protein [Acidimicrobiales bacterium]
MHAAALQIDLYIRECRSLKTKRSVLRPMLDGLRRRYRVAVAEVAYQDSWQQAAVGVAAVAPSHAHLIDVLTECERFVWSFPEVEVLRVDRRWIEEEDRDPST